MLKDITKLKILGAIFDSPTLFDFFNPQEGNKEKTIKGALLYGRNGTGKSTIAKAFRKLSGESIATIFGADAYDDADQQVILTEEEKRCIFIFDEDYVDRNIRLQQDHLDTIVMLGEAADLTEKIEKVVHERDIAKSAYEQQDTLYK